MHGLDLSHNVVLEAAKKMLRKASEFSRHKIAVCLLAAALPMAIRLATLPFIGFPYPYVHDEFSYLLGADTLAAGRLANPPHPLWVHFETFHENFEPTYASKYPPGQAAFLAFGQKFLGHPWYGVWISFGVMCACLCWMLQGWLPPLYALLGSIVAMGQIGIFGYWMDSYWGGAVPAIGGALVLGAIPRLARRRVAGWGAAALGALGLIVLANSRPYEGLAVAAASFAGLLWWRHRNGFGLLELARVTFLVVPLVVLAIGFAGMMFYNWRLTGHPLLMPHMLHEQNYAAASPFYLAPPHATPVYRHEMIRQFWIDFEKAYYLKFRANPARALFVFPEIGPFFATALLFLTALVGLVGFWRRPQMRIVGLTLAAIWLALLLEKSWLPHYYAPAAGLLLLSAMESVRWMRVRGRQAGAALVLLFVLICFGQGLVTGWEAFRKTPLPPQELARERILALGRPGERHLVIVRYTKDHSAHIEYVFNRADIDHSAIVWARDMGAEKNKELLDYYAGTRRVWLFEPDAPAFSLAAYAPLTHH